MIEIEIEIVIWQWSKINCQSKMVDNQLPFNDD